MYRNRPSPTLGQTLCTYTVSRCLLILLCCLTSVPGRSEAAMSCLNPFKAIRSPEHPSHRLAFNIMTGSWLLRNLAPSSQLKLHLLLPVSQFGLFKFFLFLDDSHNFRQLCRTLSANQSTVQTDIRCQSPVWQDGRTTTCPISIPCWDWAISILRDFFLAMTTRNLRSERSKIQRPLQMSRLICK